MFFSNRYKLTKDQKVYQYEINCPTPKDFDLILIFHADNKLLKLIWDKSKIDVKRRKGIDVRKQDFEDIKEFGVPEIYHKFLKVVTRNQVGNVARIFVKDGIIILSHEVHEAVYILNDQKGWDIKIHYKGIWTKKDG